MNNFLMQYLQSMGGQSQAMPQGMQNFSMPQNFQMPNFQGMPQMPANALGMMSQFNGGGLQGLLGGLGGNLMNRFGGLGQGVGAQQGHSWLRPGGTQSAWGQGASQSPMSQGMSQMQNWFKPNG